MELKSPEMGDRAFCHIHAVFPFVSLPEFEPPNTE